MFTVIYVDRRYFTKIETYIHSFVWVALQWIYCRISIYAYFKFMLQIIEFFVCFAQRKFSQPINLRVNIINIVRIFYIYFSLNNFVAICISRFIKNWTANFAGQICYIKSKIMARSIFVSITVTFTFTYDAAFDNDSKWKKKLFKLSLIIVVVLDSQ